MSVELAASVTPDQVGNFLDSAVQYGQAFSQSEGSWVAVGLAFLVALRLLWKKYKSSKK